VRPPVRFGKYLLLDRISVGGMAEVFKAKSHGARGFEKIVAIKRILPSLGADVDFVKMFVDEAKIAGQLAHANICQIFELGRIDGAHFIAMEFIWGKDLLQIHHRLKKLGRSMPPTMAAYIIGKACDGLDHAHRKRDPMGRALEIVHRDCSPQNVLVSYEGEVKVIDFGIAKAAMRNSSTVAGVLKGKFSYMSPEQVRGLPLDRRSDIFALGTVLYECVTGAKLFDAETDFGVLDKVRAGEIKPPRAIKPDVPEELERIILRALARDVADRYQWCSEMAADLQRFLLQDAQVFTARDLAGWLREAFAAELQREQAQLDAYRDLSPDGAEPGDEELGADASGDITADVPRADHDDAPLTKPAVRRPTPLPSARAASAGSPARVTAPPPPPDAGDFSEHPGGGDERTVAEMPAFDDAWPTEAGARTPVPSPPRAPTAPPRPAAAASPRAPTPARPEAVPTPVAADRTEPTRSEFAEDVPTSIFGGDERAASEAPVARPPTAPPGPRPASQGGGRPSTVAPPVPAARPRSPSVAQRPATAPTAPTAAPRAASQDDDAVPTARAPAALGRPSAAGGPPAAALPAAAPPAAGGPFLPGDSGIALPAVPVHRATRPVLPAGAVGEAAHAPVDATMRARRSPTLRRDLLIGVAIAVAVLSVAALLKFVVFAGDPPAAPPIADARGAVGDARPSSPPDASPAVPPRDAAATATPPDANRPPIDGRAIADARPRSPDAAPPEGRVDARVRVRPDAAPAKAEPGFLQVFSTPSASVSVDGRDTGMSTPIVGRKRLSLSPGRHRVGLELDGRTREFSVTIVAGETTTLSKTLAP
jgi:hypothetical protein